MAGTTFEADIHKKPRYANAALIFIAASVVFLNLTHLPSNILSWDVFGYYLYLPQFFQHHDLFLHDISAVHAIIDQYESTGTFYQATQCAGGNWVMKYSMGMALLYLPFFGIGHLLAILLQYPADGFSLPYQYSILSAGIFWFLIGTVYLKKFLSRRLSDKVTALTLILTVFGTNVLFSSSFYGANAMSHNFLFGMYGLILYNTDRWYETEKLRYSILLAPIIGLAVLARPSEIVCLAIPLLWGISRQQELNQRRVLLFQYRTQVILFLVVIGVIGSFQLIYWKLASGQWFYSDYGGNPGEGLDLLRPHILKALFSFRKGWFIYTPLVLLGIAGMIRLYRENRGLFLPILVYLILNTYLVTSWTNWWYAQSFGQRALMPSLAVMALPLGLLLQWCSEQKTRLIWASILISGIVGLNLFQSWQYIHGIIHPDRMTARYYWAVFGRTNIPEGASTLLLVNRDGMVKDAIPDSTLYRCSLDTIIRFEPEPGITGDNRFCLNDSFPFSSTLKLPYKSITRLDHYYVVAEAAVHTDDTLDLKNINLVLHFEYRGAPYKYESIPFIGYFGSSGNTYILRHTYMSPEPRRRRDRLVSYFWYQGESSVCPDYLRLRFYVRQ